MSNKVHTPYHFVPLSKWVYMPDWAHLVSHDYPFEDGHSGVIEYTLTNHTPLCVGHEKGSDGVLRFARDPLGRPVIPGSSLKGMVRNVLEIASFGKFSTVDDQRFSFRDISHAKCHYMTNIIKKNKVQPGWIKFDSHDQVWYFTPCQSVKVSHRELEHALGVRIKNASTAIAKYHSLPLNTKVSATISAPRGKQNNRWAESLGENGEGTIVFTNERIVGRGKKQDYEFSYYFYPQPGASRQMVSNQVADLFANHTSVSDTVRGKSWDQVSYLKSHAHPEKGIPVFALVLPGSGKVHSLGFAKMPRVTYQKSTQDMIDSLSPAHHSDSYFDMAELLMGTLRDGGLGLRSRVTFSDATSKGCHESALYMSNPIILAQPKPTFFPAYVEQSFVERDYRHYDSHSATLSGYKRYIAKRPKERKLVSNAKENTNVTQRIELAPEKTAFSGKVVFHNLKTVELAALMWCLKLEGSHHQLGHGKPMGAGVVSINPRIEQIRSHTEVDVSGIDDLFASHMESVYPSDSEGAWHQSPHIQYLLGIGKLGANDGVETDYMSLKDFQNAKNKIEKLALLRGIKRQELPMGTQRMNSVAFGQGRLAHLVNEEESWQKKQLQLAQEQKLKAELSEHGYKLHQLHEQLVGIEGSEKPPLIRAVMHFFLEEVSKQEGKCALDLYHLARANDYHKKPNKRAKEQKKELAALLEAYGVQQ